MVVFYILITLGLLSFVTSLTMLLYVFRAPKFNESEIDRELKRSIHKAIKTETGGAEESLSNLIEQKMSVYLRDIHFEMLKRLQEEEEKISESYVKITDEVRDNNKKMLAVITQEMKETVKNDLQELRAVLLDSAIRSKTALSERFEHLLADAEKEIIQYKSEKKSQIDTEIAKKTEAILREVLKESFTKEDHEKLIKEAVEKAVKGGVFSER